MGREYMKEAGAVLSRMETGCGQEMTESREGVIIKRGGCIGRKLLIPRLSTPHHRLSSTTKIAAAAFFSLDREKVSAGLSVSARP